MKWIRCLWLLVASFGGCGGPGHPGPSAAVLADASGGLVALDLQTADGGTIRCDSPGAGEVVWMRVDGERVHRGVEGESDEHGVRSQVIQRVHLPACTVEEIATRRLFKGYLAGPATAHPDSGLIWPVARATLTGAVSIDVELVDRAGGRSGTLGSVAFDRKVSSLGPVAVVAEQGLAWLPVHGPAETTLFRIRLEDGVMQDAGRYAGHLVLSAPAPDGRLLGFRREDKGLGSIVAVDCDRRSVEVVLDTSELDRVFLEGWGSSLYLAFETGSGVCVAVLEPRPGERLRKVGLGAGIGELTGFGLR